MGLALPLANGNPGALVARAAEVAKEVSGDDYGAFASVVP
jgi:hypothetical protein